MSDIWASAVTSGGRIAVSIGQMNDSPQFSRICERADDGAWGYTPLDSTIVSIAALDGDTDGAYIAALGIDGEVYFLGKSVTAEQIEGAGLGDDDGPAGLGSMNKIRLQNQRLLACGNGSQIYRRAAKDRWERLCDPETDGIGHHMFHSVSENGMGWIAACGYTDAIYTIPSETEQAELDRVAETGTLQELRAARTKYVRLERPPLGCLFIFDTQRWRRVELPGNGYLNDVIALPDGRFAAVGGGGMIVVGQEPDSFEDMSLNGFNETFHAALLLDGEIWVLGDSAVQIFDSAFRLSRSIALHGSQPSPQSIDANGQNVWYFDHQGIAKLDGQAWIPVTVPAEAWAENEG